MRALLRKSGWMVLGCLLATASLARAGDVDFTVVPDRTEIGQEESVAVKFSVKAEGNVKIEDPKFNAPDFDVVNQYVSTFIESFYDNGHFGVRNNRTVTEVLHPKKTGNLEITGLQIRVDGRVYNSSPITVRVVPGSGSGGGGTPAPRGYGGAGVGLRGAGKQPRGRAFFVRAEVDKQKAFKGEQIIVNYYLYFRVRAMGPQIDKFPTLNGFLREDLDMPAITGRLVPEHVVLDGVPYERALLTKYAAYPLKEGKLLIDPMGLKLTYYGQQNVAEDDDDPFANFFQRMAPSTLTGVSESEPITIEVAPLPDAGKTANFSGGVGDFNLMATVDKTEIHANEAVSLTLKVEGHGNASLIQEPKAKWPAGVELYESKGYAKSNPSGISDKVFEFLLIPRTAGKVTLPPLEMTFFDPAKKEYVTKSTAPIEINVLDGGPGTAAPNPGAPSGAGSSASSPTGGSGGSTTSSTASSGNAAGGGDGLRGLRPLDGSDSSSVDAIHGKPIWRWLYWMSLLAFVIFLGGVGLDRIRRRQGNAQDREADRARRMRAESKSWQRLNGLVAKMRELPWTEVVAAYESLSGAVYDALDRKYGLGARSLSRSELRSQLVDERGMPEDQWRRAEALLEFAEAVRYATQAGAVSESEARARFAEWVSVGKVFEENLNG